MHGKHVGCPVSTSLWHLSATIGIPCAPGFTYGVPVCRQACGRATGGVEAPSDTNRAGDEAPALSQ